MCGIKTIHKMGKYSFYFWSNKSEINTNLKHGCNYLHNSVALRQHLHTNIIVFLYELGKLCGKMASIA